MQHARPTPDPPVLLAVDDDAEALSRIERELATRYGVDYRVVCERSADDGLAALERMRAQGDALALVLADQWMPGTTGAELLARARALHPRCKRGLLIEWGGWGDTATRAAILRAMAIGDADYYVMKPSWTRDEQFHRTVVEFLLEFSRATPAEARELELVGEAWSPRSHELRSLLTRNGVPHAFHAHDSERGRELLAAAGLAGETRPVALLHDGQLLVDPSNTELADAFGVPTSVGERRDFDVVVVGAGPAGLAAAVYAASEGLSTLVVERESIGGQAGSSSLIRNYLGFSRGVSGSELAQRAYQQAWVFGSDFALMREASALRLGGDRPALAISDGSEVTAHTVVLATGVSYRRLEAPGLDELAGAGVYYGASTSEAQAMAGGRAFVVGGGNSAGQAAMHLSRYASEVTILIRGDSLERSMSRYLIDAIEAAGNVAVRTGTAVAGAAGDGRLSELTLRDVHGGGEAVVPADGLFVLIGARPHTEWLPPEIARDARGFLLTGPDVPPDAWPLERAPLMLETSVPGVFAAGDVRHRSVKRVAAAVGQGAAAVQQVHEYLTVEALHRHDVRHVERTARA